MKPVAKNSNPCKTSFCTILTRILHPGVAGTASGRAGGTAATGSAEAASPAGRRRWPRWPWYCAAATALAATPGHTTRGQALTSEARTFARGNHRPRGARAIRQDVQAAQDQARLHPR